MGVIMEKRQGTLSNDNLDSNSNEDWWWYSPDAAGVKWAIVGAIFIAFLAFFVGGYWHAKRRMKKGLPPLAYHRWLLPRSQRARFPTSSQPFTFYQYQSGYNDGYQMQAYPPPAYNPGYAPPPTYEPPRGVSKTNSSQAWAVPPPGAPPGQPSSSSADQQLSGGFHTEGFANARPQSQSADAPAPPARKNFMGKLNPFK